jgi:hypothetical protein
MKTLLKSFHVFILACILLFSPTGRAAAVPVQIVYVKWNAAGANNGTSWANAYTSLQVALTAAVSGYELWVAAAPNSYKPTTGADRTKTFTLKNGVAIYGGFAGTETSRDQRNPAVNITRLSGDLGLARDWADNSYHVVTSSGTDSTAVLDGFSILNGNANDTSTHNKGGGIWNVSGNPTLANLVISGNWAVYYGGGMYNNVSTIHLTHVTFSNNKANNGAGMYNEASSPVLEDVIFSLNAATTYGGGMYNNTNSNPSLTNVTFSGNSAGSDGGGIHNYTSSPILMNVTFVNNTASNGAGINNMNTASPVLTNVTFSGNAASWRGGGMMNLSNSSPILINVTFSGNTAINAGGGMYNTSDTSNPVIKNSIFWGNGTEIVTLDGMAQISDSLIQGGPPANSITNMNILSSDPFLGPLASNGGFTQTMALAVGSPAIDSGNNTTCATVDQRGYTRPSDGNSDGVATCDMGAYEYVPKIIFLPLIIR